MFGKIKKEVREVLGQIFIDLDNTSNTIFLAGTGRSGTTWLQEVINSDSSYRVMFEPFNSLKIEIIKEWNYRQYLRAENNDVKFLHPATKILTGNIRHSWIDQFNKNRIVRKRLIKDIRANLLLKWIKHNFPEIPIILLLRHPCAVANSKLKLGWDTHLEDFLTQDDLMTDFFIPHKETLQEAKDIFDRHILMWCIENYVPLKQFKEGEILVSFYENICLNPQMETESVFSFLGEPVPPQATVKIKKASSVTRKDSPVKSGGSLISSWRRDINERQIRRAVEILTLFGLHKLYNEGDGPLMSGRDALKIFSD